MHIIINRTDSIGDVVLTLPMAGILKEKYPKAKITFIGRTYTKPIVQLSQHINGFINWDELEKLTIGEIAKKLGAMDAQWIIHVFPNKKLAKAAKKSGIKNRVGTSHRTCHWLTCNRMVAFGRRKSDLHEAQLNCKLLEPLGIEMPLLNEVADYYGLDIPEQGTEKIVGLLDNQRKNIVLHPKSRGNGREWGLDNFEGLINILPKEKFCIFVSGTKEEATLMTDFLKRNENCIVDVTGLFTLPEFITFLYKVDGIVASGTGPLHISAALGTNAIGIFPPIRPIHPGRWAPLGENAHYLVKQKDCDDCRKDLNCHCIREILPVDVKDLLLSIF